MRAILVSLLVLGLNGCAQSSSQQRSSVASTPVKYEPPTISARSREMRQRQAEKDAQAHASVEGNIVR